VNGETLTVLFSTIVTCWCCAYLVLHPDYDDGAFGRTYLVVGGFTAFVMLFGILTAQEVYTADPLILVLIVAHTLILARTAFKFWLWHRFGISSWRPKQRTCT